MEQTIRNTVEVDDSWVTVDVYGEKDGRALVVLPGVMADAASWAAVARSLTGWETVAIVNRRGRRPSGPLTAEYGLQTEVADAEAVLRQFSDVHTLFGWSFGGLIALRLANRVPVPHLIAYEPIMAPFGSVALPDLKRAHCIGDLDRTVEVALGQVTGMPEGVIESIRSDDVLWASLRDVSSPLYNETLAINEGSVPAEFAHQAGRIDLIVGERNRGRAPYGVTFDDVTRLTPRGVVHELPGQAHLAHLEAPDQLAALISRLHVPGRGGVAPDSGAS